MLLHNRHLLTSSSRTLKLFCATLAAILCCAVGACRQDPSASAQRDVESGNRYASAGKYAEAIVEYRNALRQDPKPGQTYAKLADAYLKTGDVVNGLLESVRAADLLPADTQLQLKACNLLLLAARFDDAKSRAEKLLANDPHNVEAQVVIANALAGLTNLDGAVSQIEEAIRVDPDRSGSYSSLGALELGRGKRDAAEQAFLKAVELQPRSVTAQLALANFYWLTGKKSEAQKTFDTVLGLDPRNPLVNRALASFYLATNRRSEAEGPLTTVWEVTQTSDSAFALSEYFAVTGNEARAKEILSPLLTDPRSAAAANIRIAAMDHKNGHNDLAYKRLSDVLGRDTDNLQALLLKTDLLVADGKLEDALASATHATQRHADSASAMFMLGRVQASRRQPEAAIGAFQETLRLNPRATDAELALAQLNLAQGRPDASIGFAVDALANEPGNGNAQLILVRGLLSRGELDRADTALKQLALRYPKSAAVHTQMGMLLGRRRQFAQARSEFERALQLQPEGVDALGGLIAIDLATRDFAAARARIDARMTPDATAQLLTLAARTYAASSDSSGAEQFLVRAIQRDSSYLNAYEALGQLYVAAHQLPAARTQFETLVERSPKSVGPQTMLGIILEAQGDRHGAQTRYEHVLELDPEAAVAANNLACIYSDNGANLDIALHLAQTAQRHLPELPQVNDTLGYVYYQKKLASLAVTTLRVSVEKEPANPTYQYHLGLAYASAGDAPSARQSLSRALALSASFDGAQTARDTLQSLSAQ